MTPLSHCNVETSKGGRLAYSSSKSPKNYYSTIKVHRRQTRVLQIGGSNDSVLLDR